MTAQCQAIRPSGKRCKSGKKAEVYKVFMFEHAMIGIAVPLCPRCIGEFRAAWRDAGWFLPNDSATKDGVG